MSSAPTHSEPIARVGNFELLRLIGEGSMGRVYEARHARLPRMVAVKMLRQDQANDAELVRRFFQEARTVNRINHPHIVEIHDFVEDLDDSGQPRAWCVMEYLDGETLSAILARGPVPVERSLRIIDQVCRALAAAHGVGVVHRDIKPDNILIVRGPDGRDFVKVLDFGVAKLVRPDPEIDVETTHEGAIVGTPRYMSPEQAASLDVDARTDVYAVGCLLYELLSGRPPFEGEAFGQLAARILTQLPSPIDGRSASGEEVSPELESLTLQCLEKDPALRPQSLEQVRARLSLPGQAGRKVRRIPLRAMVATAALVAVGVGMFALAPRRQAAPPAVEVASPVTIDTAPELPLVIPPLRPGEAPETVSATQVVEGTQEAPAAAEENPTRKASLRSRSVGGRRSIGAASDRESRDAVLNPFVR